MTNNLTDNISVLIDIKNSNITKLSLELLGKARELADKSFKPLNCILIGSNIKDICEDLKKYDIDNIHVYEDVKLKNTFPDVYVNILETYINNYNPSVLLLSHTDNRKAIASKLAARFNTGLTTGCVDLDIDKDTMNLLQIKPIFTDDLMAEMICENKRPQIATVKSSSFNSISNSKNIDTKISIESLDNINLNSDFELIEKVKRELVVPIEDAEVLVVAGQGFKNKEDLSLAKELAKKLNGEFAVSRPLVQLGWADHKLQVGISGKTVKPRLIITIGVSGAVQFTIGMDKSEQIIAINQDKDAPIFKIANYGLVGDLYEILPNLLNSIH